MTPQQKKALKIKAAGLNPIILIGNKGLTESLQKEIGRALHDHELLKIRFHSKDREFQKEAAETICKLHEASLIDSVGHVIVIYRPQQQKD